MNEAKKDGRPVLAAFRRDLVEHTKRDDLDGREVGVGPVAAVAELHAPTRAPAAHERDMLAEAGARRRLLGRDADVAEVASRLLQDVEVVVGVASAAAGRACGSRTRAAGRARAPRSMRANLRS